jgi:hypothetical protein
MPITKADSIRVDGLDAKQSRLLLIKVASQQGWDWWFDNEEKLIIDVDGSFKDTDNEKRMD